MNKNITQDMLYKDEINLVTVLQILFNSKKIIIASIIFFSTLALVFSMQKQVSYDSIALIEIGHLSNQDDLIEDPSSIIKDFKINLVYKNLSKEPLDKVNLTNNLVLNNLYRVDPSDLGTINFYTLEDKIIKINFKSESSENNKEILGSFLSYLEDKHSEILKSNLKKNQQLIIDEIDLLETEIAFYQSKFLDENNNNILLTNIKINSLEDSLKRIDEFLQIFNANKNLEMPIDVSQLLKENSSKQHLEQFFYIYDELIEHLNKKQKILFEINLLENELELLTNQNPKSEILFSLFQKKEALESKLKEVSQTEVIETKRIGEIETEIIKPNKRIHIFIGFVFGLLFGILFVLAKDFASTFKKVSKQPSK